MASYPARLKKVLIVTAPLWFKALIKILRLFVRKKLRERVFTVSVPQLALHVPHKTLSLHLGGTLEVDHDTSLLSCRQSMMNREDKLLANIMDVSDGSGSSSETGSEFVSNNQKTRIISAVHQLGDNNTADNNSTITYATTAAGAANGATTNGGREFLNPPSSSSSDMSIDDSLDGQEGDSKSIHQIVQMMKQGGLRGLIEEYAVIRSRPPEGTFWHSRMHANLTKNRFADVLCYDQNRVVLTQEDGDEASDYINANFVDGYKEDSAYITTQGPLPNTCKDFWRMIWEQHCLLIVMTMRVVERGCVKCVQYWEPTEEGSLEFGDYHVRTISVECNEGYMVTSLELRNIKTDEVRNVSHWQFTSWPDYGIPSSAMTMLNFVQKVREKQAQVLEGLVDTWAGHPLGPPIVVHCSAGIGRSGTFITLATCISRLEDVGTVDIRGTVEKIRSQRAHCLQMPEQYVFCHLALIEYAYSRGMLKPTDLVGFDQHEPDSE
ncbi:tyrosine-protein phosphatase non-receptor type 9 [Drosophila sechellia]|uniref:tyrosine-protein phosphatase non-receptor type 9 n=1 Tax=Drosophila sechellia TaxID=7238 RepID=UPI0013DE3C74|nr:tyrosine-protein phosphatase non-receptor type 9 [Drosophila sechellia]